MRYVGRDVHRVFMARVRGVDPQRCLVVPVDVGKWSAKGLIADHHGEVLVDAFEFVLDEPGVVAFAEVVARVNATRSEMVCRFDSGFWSNDTIATLKRLGVRYTMAVRTNTSRIAAAITAIAQTCGCRKLVRVR
jgi:hypothetical protein